MYMWDILMFWNCIKFHSMYNILFQYTCEIYWCSETVSHVTPCTIFCFNIHVRYIDVLKLYHMSLNLQYPVSVFMWDILLFWNSITRNSMYNIMFQYICEVYWCSETVSHFNPCTIFCFNIHFRYTDVLKLHHISLHVQYSVLIYMWDILIFWKWITCHSMYNILFQYSCEIYWNSETVAHVTPCTIFCFNIQVRYTDILKLYHMSLHVQYSVSVYMWDILMFRNCVTRHSMYNIVAIFVWDILMFRNCITCHSMYNNLYQYTCEIYWCSETVSHVTPCTTSFQYLHEIYRCSETVPHVTPCTTFCFSIHVRYTYILLLCHVSLHVQHCFSIYVRYTEVLKLYHMSLHVQYSVSTYMWDILMFWNCVTCHSMYNILFQYTCEIYWCSETMSHFTPCTIFYFNIHVRYTDVLELCHISLHAQYTISIYMWDILMFWNCITCHSIYNILFEYTCEIYWFSGTVSHVTPCTIYYFNMHVRYTDVLRLFHMSLHVQYSV